MNSVQKPVDQYLDKCAGILETIRNQIEQIETAANWFAESIAAGRVVHLFGAGHSRIMVEEMWPRYGSFPGFNPIVELSLTFHNAVIGSNGQRQAMFLENQTGFAARILRNFELSAQDSALVISSSGCNIVPIEIADLLQQSGMKVVAIISRAHSAASTSNHPDGKKLSDVATLTLDNGAPAGDAMAQIPGLDVPVAPGSTVGGCIIVNALKAEIAKRLAAEGKMPSVLTASCIVGGKRSAEMFEQAYDQHSNRMSKLYERK